MNVLFIDGAAYGELRDIGDMNDVVIAVPPDTTVDSYDKELALIKQRYFVHQFQLCGYRIRIASIHSVTENIDPYDVFNNIVSVKARAATVQ
jgi:hypothetical protein